MGMQSYGHCVQAVEDLPAATRFYADILGEALDAETEVTEGSMNTTDQILRQIRRRKRDGAMAVPHSGVTVGKTLLPLFLYSEHVQWPPPEQLIGTPRIALTVSPEQMDKAVEVFRKHNVAFEGPVQHPAPSPVAASVYFKDPSSNFLELCCPRSEQA